MEWKKTDATTDEAPGKAQAEAPAAARMDEEPAAQAEAPTAAQAGEILKKAADTPSTVPGAARMNEEPAAQSGTDGQDLESEAAQPDVGGASQAATNAPAVQAGESTAARADESFAAQSGGRGRLLRQLFFATLYISACTFGGGFVIVTFMRRRFVEQLHWLDEREMLDFTALAQSAPGAIAVNAAVLVGWRVAGFCGMLAAALGTVLPPMVILSVISLGYRAFADNRCVALALGGMQAGVAAVVLDVVCGLGGTVLRERSPLHIAVMAAAFIAGALLGVNVVYVILAAALAGVGHALLRRRARGARP